ncbi:UDP-N-acetylmuramoyl-L-alanine--D-glutamate ligase [Alkalibacillus haloalkaliphilus]|uniref:UDP-N-acetylmuramoylalanine--D-glutamate ligase n=1 Tax=Alkalibacillus haloalkaliphilus TaxID=94136 RepID=A0A511W633_9BACI|nr:UDP-N-acetylmuramoyl-L-alanine--D-glutamate ligase [Alkalibacillus haloalkaliphilus]GEN44822.1 UDP-N-acetylmuramoylalanine--D-glutamate ligase [Alkalibacillus haloalkaliphilus]
MKTLRHFPYNKVLVLGLAKSGEAAAQLLYDSGIPFLINDQQAFDQNEKAQYFNSLGVETVTGHHPLNVLDGVDLVVKNPGIPHHHNVIQEAEKLNIPVVTEVELAYELIDGPLIAITGTNGKTTTTTLIYELLKEAGKDPLLAGNIGQVASEVVRKQKDQQPVVMELSSFQLKAIQNFKPDVSVLLNITEAHLDYHKSREDYINSKLNIVKRQSKEDLVVYNGDDSTVSESLEDCAVQKMAFTINHFSHEGVSFDGRSIYFNNDWVIDREDVVLPGMHNLENILASVAVAKHFGVQDEVIQTVLTRFIGVKHRLQFVENKNGRLFYNDSKATNILATTKALQSFSSPVVLVIGGLDRGNDFDELFQQFNGVRSCVAYGEAREKIKQAAKRQQFDRLYVVDNLEQATRKAYEQSEEGDIVLLSPACASWDQFKSFEDRGDMFIEVVHKL